MPQLLFPGDPFAMGIEVGLAGAFFGLDWDRAIMLGVTYFAWNVYIKQMVFQEVNAIEGWSWGKRGKQQKKSATVAAMPGSVFNF